MYKSILINHGNTPESLNELISSESIIDFKYSDSKYNNLDEYISKEIIQNYLIDKKPSIIYIKDNLSVNYLELYGLRVAYHIRFSQELKDIRYVPIVVLSDLDGYTLNKLEPMARILFTKNIFLEANTQETIKTFNRKDISKLTEKEFSNKFLKLIEIEPPENSTSHSIANEWAIYKWAKELKIQQFHNNKILEALDFQLYFKYLKEQNDIIEKVKVKKSGLKIVSSNLAKLKLSKTTRILYIDDEWDKGWKDIFSNYFLGYEGFKIIDDIEFKNKKFENIKEPIIERVKNYKPDLIILDMRLVQNDQDDHGVKTKPQNISGIKLLNKIKNISIDSKLNPGMQVIMLTATGRSDILEHANKDNKILGYIKKDHINDKTISTKENIEKFTKLVNKSKEKFYLKEIWDIQSDILKKINDKKSLNDIRIDITSVFSVLNSNVENPYNFTVFTFTKCLEAISMLYINEYTMKYLDDGTNIRIYDHNKNVVYDYKNEKWYKGTENRLHNILYEKLDLEDKNYHIELCELINCRNNLAHPNGRKPHSCNLIEKVDHFYIVKWFTLLKTIIFKISEEKSLK